MLAMSSILRLQLKQSVFISTMYQMTVCNMKGVACSDKPTENYHLSAVLLGSTQ